MEDILDQISIRFGVSRIRKLREFDNLKQKANETNVQYADRVRKTALGLERHPEDIVYKYLTTLTNSSSIYDFVINHKPANLQEAVEYVEAHSKSHPSASSDRSQLRCSLCKRLGHTAKTCRSKGGNKNNQRAKKVDVIEEEDTLVAHADVDSDGDDSGSYGEPETHDVQCLSEGE